MPSFARPESLARCLRALAEQSRPPDEVIVVMRRGDSPTRAAVERADPPVRGVLIDESLQTYAMDAGVRVAAGDVVALTDDDAAPRPDWLARLMAHYADPTVGCVGGRDVVHDPTVPGSAVRAPRGTVRWFGRTEGHHHRAATWPAEVAFLKGVNLSVRRSLWHLDHDLVGWGSQPHWELGLCLRARALGWRVVFDPAVLVDHYTEPRRDEPSRVDRAPRVAWRDAHNELLELVRWLPSSRWPLAVVFALIVGSTPAPGPVATLVNLARGERPFDALRRLRAATRGRIMALARRPRRNRATAAS